MSLNTKYLIGSAIDEKMEGEICQLIMNDPIVESMYIHSLLWALSSKNVQTQYLGSTAFTFKADVDIDGTYVAAALSSDYLKSFQQAMDKNVIEQDLPCLLCYYSEDVSRIIEKEFRAIEKKIRTKYPDAQYIDLTIASDISDYLKLAVCYRVW